jgi:hypothetical protein
MIETETVTTIDQTPEVQKSLEERAVEAIIKGNSNGCPNNSLQVLKIRI